MGSISPTQRTLAFLRKAGFAIGSEHCCERWLPSWTRTDPVTKEKKQVPGKRSDLWGLFDYAIPYDGFTIGVQTTGTAHADHRRKMMASPSLILAVHARWIPLLISWRKINHPLGWNSKVYRPRLELVYPENAEVPDSARELLERLERA